MKIDEFKKEYWFLSNYSPSLFKDDDGLEYPTVEHYFQSKKTKDLFEQTQIRLAPSPGEAKRLGRRCHLRTDWNDIKEDIMRQGVHYKFTQNPNLAKRLLATGDAELIEGNTWNDREWGVCDGIGANKLGKILMEEREKLKNDNS